MFKESPSITNVWTQRNLGIDLAQNIELFTPADIEYLCNNYYPFVQLINSEAIFDEEVQIKFITTSFGWTIHDYGDAISTSASHDIKNRMGSDTTKQIDAAYEIAKLIATKGWTAIEFIAGSALLQHLLWITSKRYNFQIKGYAPTAEEEKCCERLKKHLKANWVMSTPKRPGEELTASGATS